MLVKLFDKGDDIPRNFRAETSPVNLRGCIPENRFMVY